MSPLARALRWIADATRPAPRGYDPADMGTAFGLDAITSTDAGGDGADTSSPPGQRADGSWSSPFEPRPPRRSAY